MHASAPVFRSAGTVYRADTCEPLKAAAERGDLRIDALSHGSYPGRRLPVHTLPEVCSVGFWDAPRNQSWGLDWHRNEGLELTYLSRGKTEFVVDGRTNRLRARPHSSAIVSRSHDSLQRCGREARNISTVRCVLESVASRRMFVRRSMSVSATISALIYNLIRV